MACGSGGGISHVRHPWSSRENRRSRMPRSPCGSGACRTGRSPGTRPAQPVAMQCSFSVHLTGRTALLHSVSGCENVPAFYIAAAGWSRRPMEKSLLRAGQWLALSCARHEQASMALRLINDPNFVGSQGEIILCPPRGFQAGTGRAVMWRSRCAAAGGPWCPCSQIRRPHTHSAHWAAHAALITAHAICRAEASSRPSAASAVVMSATIRQWPSSTRLHARQPLRHPL